MIINIDKEHFANWLLKDYRMHEEEFETKTFDEKKEIIEEYESHIKLFGE